MVAVAPGARPPARVLIAFSVIAVAALTAAPAAGSTDSISYAASGRTAIGGSPYVIRRLRWRGPATRLQADSLRRDTVKLDDHGIRRLPVATGAEWVAAELGGTSLAHIIFWLKLLEALSFCAVIWNLDRLLRPTQDEAMRLRAHLLWSVNPLLLWEIVAGGHIDGLAVVFGLLGIVALRARPQHDAAGPAAAGPSRPSRGPAAAAAGPAAAPDAGYRLRVGAAGAALSGLLIGVAAGIKVEYALFGLAVAWACRRSPRALAAAAAGFAVAVIPAYLAAGTAAVKVLLTRSPGVTWDTMYQLFWRPVLGYTQFSVSSRPPHLELVAYLLFAAVAVLTVLRFPDRVPGLPAVTPALALSLAWLFVTAFQRPWYDVMAISLLALYTASRLDWVVLVRLLAGATVYAQAIQNPAEPHWLYDVAQFDGTWLTPTVRLLAALALVWLCVWGRWRWSPRSPALLGRLPELLSLT